MIRLAVFVLLIIVVYKLLRGLLKKISVSDKREVRGDQVAADLVRDPQCGAYILPAQGISARVGGKTFHFCSESCKDKFILEQSDKKDDKTG